MIDFSVLDGLKVLVKNLRKGKIYEATEMIPEAVKTIQSLISSNQDSELRNIAFAIRIMLDSFQRRDYVLMADVLEYEILPFLYGNIRGSMN